MNVKDNVIFVSGIDTDAGKSYATGWLARSLSEQGLKVITLKFIQTGNCGRSEDIEIHRRIMGIDPLPEDLDLTTAPMIFSYPASPHLAAKIDGRQVDLSVIDRSIEKLSAKYDVVIVEGAGGLMVPVTDDMLTIEYPETRKLPIALVTNGRLGSISHTILALEAIKHRGIRLHSMIYNEHFDNDEIIAPETRNYLKTYLNKNFPGAEMLFVPSL